MNNILIINPHGIGDVLFTTPLVNNVRRCYPKAKIVYMANRRAEEFLRQDKAIDSIIVYERDEFIQVYDVSPIQFYLKWFKLWQDIRRAKFDLVLDLSMTSTFGMICFSAGIPKRIGFDYKGRGRFLTHRIAFENFGEMHVVDNYLKLLESLNIPIEERNLKVHVSPSVETKVQAWFDSFGVKGNQPVIAVVPGGGASWGKQAQFKRWPAQKYAQLVDKIIAKSDAVIILMGDKSEEALSLEITALVSSPNIFSLVGKTSILEMAAVFKSCTLAITNDGGPLHVAVASGVRTVSIFGPVDPRTYGPYPRQNHIVVQKMLACQPCYKRFRVADCSHIDCLNTLSVDEVYRKVESIV